MVAQAVSIPVIACGGAGKIEHIAQVISEGKADGVGLASILHYDYIARHEVEFDPGSEGNISFLKSGRVFSKIDPSDLPTIKEYLYKMGIECRYP
jgi:cyclase